MATVHVKTTVHPRNYRELCPCPRGVTVRSVPITRTNRGYQGVTVILIPVQLSSGEPHHHVIGCSDVQYIMAHN